jgi:hypothetical protein
MAKASLVPLAIPGDLGELEDVGASLEPDAPCTSVTFVAYTGVSAAPGRRAGEVGDFRRRA